MCTRHSAEGTTHFEYSCSPCHSPGPSSFLLSRNNHWFELGCTILRHVSRLISILCIPKRSLLFSAWLSIVKMFPTPAPAGRDVRPWLRDRFHGLLWGGRRRAHVGGVREDGRSIVLSNGAQERTLFPAPSISSSPQ